MKQLSLGFIGLGLIGGSAAKALRLAIPDVKITVFDPNPETLKAALADKVADDISASADHSFSHCDCIFLCAPVSCNDANLIALKKVISSSCILTDVGSVKGGIHRYIEELGLSSHFIGGHPMAGSERCGYLNSKAGLFENAYYILTPGSGVSEEQTDTLRKMVCAMGAIPLILHASEHDYITAAISHLPHVISACLVNLVRRSDSEDGLMKLIAAGGFKDITRISSSSPDMWQQICLSNSDNITALLDDYISSLIQVRKEIHSGNGSSLYRFFDDARMYRDSFPNFSGGPIKTSYAVTVDIIDQAGALSHVASLLASRSISMKNLGITHNREVEEGALRIEFYKEEDISHATELLAENGYIIHHKK